MVRAKTRAQQEKTKKQNAYIEKYRQDPKYVFEENRNKILRRIKAGSIPHKESLATYKITIETINDIRRRMGLSLLGLHLPYYQEVQRQQEGGMGIPDNSEIFGGFEGGDENEEVEQSAPPPAPTSAPASAPAQENPWDAVARAAPPLFTVEDISLYLQKNPGKASAKSNKDASNKTRDTQWGRPNPRGFQNTGNFYMFMKFLGDEYVRDVRKVAEPGFIEHLQNKLKEDRPNTVVREGDNKFKLLETTSKQFVTLLKALRLYPAFDGQNLFKTNNRMYQRVYDKIDRVYNQFESRMKAEKLTDGTSDNQIVVDWDTLKSKVFTKFTRYSKEVLYIKCFNEFPMRDNYKNVRLITDSNARIPTTDLDIENVKENTIYLTSTLREAQFFLVDYKTKGTYGAKVLKFSESLTNELKEYVKSNKVSKTLFGTQPMSKFVSDLLDSIGIRKGSKAEREKDPTLRMAKQNINYLRKSYVSTAMSKFKGNAQERIDLAWLMNHAPTSSLIYNKELLKDDKYKLENADPDTVAAFNGDNAEI